MKYLENSKKEGKFQVSKNTGMQKRYFSIKKRERENFLEIG